MQLPQHIANRPPGQQVATETASAALEGRGRRSRPAARSLYIHTPFCIHKCHYCDFYSFVDTRDQQSAFVDRLVSELSALAPHADGLPLKTIFVGGGTPSLLRPELWGRLLAALDDLFDLSLIRGEAAADEYGLAEFTVECNPESATAELLGLLRAGGVSRVSVGAQSFHPRLLEVLERRHDPENVHRAIEAAREAGIPRRSIDLIFAIPGQTMDQWDADLRRALTLGIDHVSCYSLTYEPNTAMTRRLAMGEFEPVSEELEMEMFRHTRGLLLEHGMSRYEVSNFGRPSSQSRHNIAYWIHDQWLAAGPSASGHVWGGADLRSGSHRWKNVPRLGDYLAGREGFSPVVDHEPPDPPRLIRERIMTGLRTSFGVDARRLLDDLSIIDTRSVAAVRSAAVHARDAGHLEITGDHAAWTLTEAGFLVADRVAAELMASIAGQDSG